MIVDKKVNAGDTVSPGQALLTMYDRERMQMVATVRESLAMDSRSARRSPRGSIRWGWIATPRSPRSCPRPRPRAGHSR